LPFHSMITGTREFIRGPRRLRRILISLGRSSPNGILIESPRGQDETRVSNPHIPGRFRVLHPC
ncbi:MAG: hypothetical protein WA785_24235, partial [Candidatus Acidiferrales bacterium]